MNSRRALAFAILTMVLGRYGFAQSATGKVTLDLGSVTVWLGMPKQEALSKFATAGYLATQVPHSVNSDSTVVQSGDHAYSLEFDAGRLSYAARSWSGKNADPFDAVMGALGALAKYDRALCEVNHEPLSQPDSSADRIFLSCGKRSVLIIKGKLGGHEVADVLERIGEPR